MSQRWLRRGLAGASALFLACAPVSADVVLGSWENTTDGWIDWGTQGPIDGTPSKYSYVTSPGVTLGSNALQITQGGWGQNLAYKLQQDYSPALDKRDEFFEHTQFAIDWTVPGSNTAGWAEMYNFYINSPAGFTGQQPTPIQLGWDANGPANPRTQTLVYDYSHLMDNDPNNGEITGTTPGWLEFIMATNNDANHPIHIFDNARLTSNRLAVDLNGGSSPGTGHPNQRGFRRWDNLPTVGQNGDPAQNGYPTGSATASFTSGIVSSGTINASLRSRDVVGVNAPSYQATANLNSYDFSIPGRDLDQSGGFTQNRDAVYRDVVVAETGIASNGTNHRMEIELTGLNPNTPYKVKFYAYDNSNTKSVNVFTDVTSQPLIFMPNANSSNGSFAPGDGSAGTQYAPSGQYIDGTGATPFSAGPESNDFRAIELYAVSDGTGKLVFAQTTVTGLSGATQVLPVLNGFELTPDTRSFTSTGGGNWNDSANWSGGVPNAKGQVANFANNAGTVTVDAPTTVGRINFGNGSITVDGTSTLTLDDTSINSTLSFNTTGRTEINNGSATADHTISAPLQLRKDTQVWVSNAARSITLSNLQPAGVRLTKVGAGKLVVNNVRTNALNVSAGIVQVQANGNAGGLSVIGSLNISAGAGLDLADNDLVVNNGSYSNIRNLVLSGFGGTTDIHSSTTDGSQILALFDNAQVGAGDWLGETIGANAVVGKYTYFGDANIDGQVTGDDYGVIDANLATTPAAGLEWLSGDMNLDGSVTGDDYGVIDANLGLGVGNPLTPSSLSAVPEPAMLGLSALVLVGLARRRRAQ